MLSHSFTHAGRQRRLFKRRDGRSAFWYLKLTVNGQRVQRSLETSDTATAVAGARVMLDAAAHSPEKWRAYLAATAKHQVASATVADLCAAYRRFARDLVCAGSNINALHNLLRRVHGADCDTASLTLDHVNEDLVWKYKQTVLDAADGQPEERALQLQRSANSILRQARSLFKKELLPQYRRVSGLVVPACVESFHSAPGFDKVAKTDYSLPDDLTIARTFDEIEKLPGQPGRRNLYLAVWLALGFGLRLSEIAQARWGWFKLVGGVLVLRSDVLGKDGFRSEIPAQLGAWSKLSPFAPPLTSHLSPRPSPLSPLTSEDFVLSGSASHRYDVGREAADWMHSLGWRTQKSIHEFRAFAGCQVGMAQGWAVAQVFMRHKDLSTTQRFYGRYYRPQIAATPLVLPAVDTAKVVQIA